MEGKYICMTSNDGGNAATCPFCGSHDVMIGRDIMTNEWYMECFDCKMSTKDNSNKEVINYGNS